MGRQKKPVHTFDNNNKSLFIKHLMVFCGRGSRGRVIRSDQQGFEMAPSGDNPWRGAQGERRSRNGFDTSQGGVEESRRKRSEG